MKKYVQTSSAAAAFAMLAFTTNLSAKDDCVALMQTVSLEVNADKLQVLEIVAKHVSAAPNCACEIVKSAIKVSDAKSKAVASIVEAAITAAPEQMRLISQCAIATAPDAAADIQSLLATLDPNSGDTVTSSKSGKAPAEVADESWNPLDFPSGDRPQVGPFPGTDGGNSFLLPGPQFDSPPIIDTPVITNPNPIVVVPIITVAP